MKLSLVILMALVLTGCGEPEPSLTKKQIDEQIAACEDAGAEDVIFYSIGRFSGDIREIKRIQCTFTLGGTGRKYARPATEFLKQGE